MASARGRLFVTAAATALIGLIGLAGWFGDAGAAEKPHLSATPSSAAIGQTVTVVGSGFPARDIFQVQVCGQEARNGSADCAAGATSTIQAQANGNLNTPVTVVIPPTPCPCVVAAFSITSSLTVLTPITIPGASFSSTPVSTPQVARSHVVVAKSELAGSTPIAAWFGFPATRTLDLTLTNTGAGPANSLHLIADVNSTPIVNSRLSPLRPGQMKTYDIPVTFPALSVGNLNLNGHIFTGDGQQVAFRVPVAIWPVGLLLAAIVLIQIILLAVRNVLRRRRERDRPDAPSDPRTADVPVVESAPTEPVAPV